MLIKPFFHKAIAVKIVIALSRIAPKQKGVFFRIHTETVLGAIASCKCAFGIMLCKRTHIIAVVQKSLVLTKRIDNLVKLFLKLVRFPLRSCIKPSSVKAISRRCKISTQVSDITCLSLKLHTLSVGVFLFGRG